MDNERPLPPYVSPLASTKLSTRIHNFLEKAATSSEKTVIVKEGLKPTVKLIKRKLPGFVLINSDVSPVDTISHIPVFCEENQYPYIWIVCEPFKEILKSTLPDVPILFIAPPADARLKKRYDRIYSTLTKKD